MQQTLDAALAVLMDNLNPADRQAVEALSDRVCVAFEAHGSAAHAATLRSAVASRRLVEAMYYSASSDRKRTYRLKPLALVAHGGVVYLVALDTAAKDREKLFRLDRLQAVVPVAETFAAPPVDLERFRTPRLYFGAEASPAQVWIAASRFEAVAEHFTADDILAQDASGTHLRLATDSPAWLSRWALQFGLDAQILAPPQGRRHMGTLCAEAAALYAQPPVPVALDAPQ
jgi:predicted DNA-binding transcriptional regulator YafY